MSIAQRPGTRFVITMMNGKFSQERIKNLLLKYKDLAFVRLGFFSTKKNRNFIKKLYSSDRSLSLSYQCPFPQNVQHNKMHITKGNI